MNFIPQNRKEHDHAATPTPGLPAARRLALLGAAIVVLILLCQYFWPGGVVLCIVLFSTPVETYVSYALNRILDTAVGVIAALLVNYLLPRRRVVALWEGFKGFFHR